MKKSNNIFIFQNFENIYVVDNWEEGLLTLSKKKTFRLWPCIDIYIYIHSFTWIDQLYNFFVIVLYFYVPFRQRKGSVCIPLRREPIGDKCCLELELESPSRFVCCSSRRHSLWKTHRHTHTKITTHTHSLVNEAALQLIHRTAHSQSDTVRWTRWNRYKQTTCCFFL